MGPVRSATAWAPCGTSTRPSSSWTPRSPCSKGLFRPRCCGQASIRPSAEPRSVAKSPFIDLFVSSMKMSWSSCCGAVIRSIPACWSLSARRTRSILPGSGRRAEWMMMFQSPSPCAKCSGARLRLESLAVHFEGMSIAEFAKLPMGRSAVVAESAQLDDRQNQIAGRILDEIRRRLGFLNSVGLDYLSLDRSAATLSGGEAQRVRASDADWNAAPRSSLRPRRTFDRASRSGQREAPR